MLRRHGIGLRTLLMLADGVLAVVLLGLLSIIRFGVEWLTHWQPILQEPLAFAIAYSVIWIGILWLHGLYRPRSRWTLRSEALAIARSAVVMGLITLSILFVFKLPEVSRSYLTILFPIQWLVTLASRAALRVGFERLRRQGRNQRFVLFVGAGPRAQAFARKVVDHRELGLTIVGFLDDEPQTLPDGWRYLGPLTSIETLLHSEVIDEVVVCLPINQWDRINAIAQLCEEEGKIVRLPVDFLEHAFAMGRIEELDGTPVYSLVSGPDRVTALVVKRAIDVVVSAAGLIVLSPLLLALAVAIRLRDGRPILFRQTRVGLHGRPFDVMKFRTMVADAEERYGEVVGMSDPRAFKVTNDPRITATGRFLRRTSLDELPQLWNVIRGEMSLVGPRPAPPREVEGYDLWHRRRLSMKPGITGLWQVSARGSDDFDGRAELDLNYIDRWSLWLDLKILARTVPAALEGR